jgi:hypothetical protein
MVELSERQWAIVYAAILEASPDVIIDALGGTEYSDVTEQEIDDLYWIAQEECGADLPQ